MHYLRLISKPQHGWRSKIPKITIIEKEIAKISIARYLMGRSLPFVLISWRITMQFVVFISYMTHDSIVSTDRPLLLRITTFCALTSMSSPLIPTLMTLKSFRIGIVSI